MVFGEKHSKILMKLTPLIWAHCLYPTYKNILSKISIGKSSKNIVCFAGMSSPFADLDVALTLRVSVPLVESLKGSSTAPGPVVIVICRVETILSYDGLIFCTDLLCNEKLPILFECSFAIGLIDIFIYIIHQEIYKTRV